jgi:DNA invertase Pin-like site-specific DNA recombinase
MSPRNAIVLARISDARDGDEHGVTHQTGDGRKLAKRLGWKVGPERTHILTENDTSAFKRKIVRLPDGSTALRTVRPKFRQALAMLADGRADGLIALDLDRACRDPRDLEDLIDVVESRNPRVPVESVTGSLRLANDADVTMARVMVAVANKSSRDTGRRVASSHSARATDGKFRGGPRPFGFEPDGTTLRPPEAAEIQRIAQAILDGQSLRSLVNDLRAREVPTVTGTEWSVRSLRGIMLRERNAAITVYKGEETGKADWPAILSEDEYRAVVAVLTDPARKTSPGNQPRHLGSLIYRCGACNDGTPVTVSGRHGKPGYYCKDYNHLRRDVAKVDDLVTEALISRLERPDAAAELIHPDDDGPDARALHTEASRLRSKLNELASMYARDIMTAAQFEVSNKAIVARLREVETALAASAEHDPAAGIAGRANAREIWDAMPLDGRRNLIRAMLKVTILPASTGRNHGGGYFDPDAIDIQWRR